MDKKDTILVTMMLNVVLLTMLFMFGEKDSQEEKMAPISSKLPTLSMKPETEEKYKGRRRDDLDQLLHQYGETDKEEMQTIPSSNSTSTFQGINRIGSEFQPDTLKEPKGAANPIEIVVRAGDTLDKISRTYGVSVEELMKINHLIDTRLQIGQTLRLSKKDVEKSHVEKFYVVRNGDNPWTIAMKNHMKVEELLRMNNLDEEKAKRLKPGDRLRIR